MEWQALGWRWLAHACFASLALLGAVSLALPWIRQPARRLRLIEWTLIACLAAPWLQFLPGIPQTPLSWSRLFRPAAVSRREALAAQVPRQDAFSLRPDAGRPSPSNRPRDLVQPIVRTGNRWPLVVHTLYAAGAAAFLLRWIAGALALRRLLRTSMPAPASAVRLLRDLAGADAMRTLLATSRAIDGPMTFGWRRPVILVPERLCREESEEALRYALAHEWSHVERRDVLAWHLSTIVQVLFFYQPLAWHVRRQMRLCQDYLADARAAAQGTAAEDYADYLVALALRRVKSPPLPALTFGDRRSQLFRRVIMLLERREPLEQRCRFRWTLASFAAALAMALGLATVNAGGENLHEGSLSAVAGEPVVYHGHVCDDETGRPIAGAVVAVRRREAGMADDRVLQESVHLTDSAGRFRFALLPEHLANSCMYFEYDVEHRDYASKTGVTCSLDDALEMNAAGGPTAVGLIRLRRGEDATGVVETADGRPAIGVEVAAYSQSDRTPGKPGAFSRTKTDSAGRFRIKLATGYDAVLCFQSSGDLPFVHVTRRQRGDLGRFRLISLAGKQGLSSQVADWKAPREFEAAAAVTR